jgi:hypothetical protein
MAVQRGTDGSDPVRPEPIARLARPHEERLASRSGDLAAGTLACPACDAPVALAAGPLSPTDPLTCPFCLCGAPVRDFLSLSTPSRPARVEVRVVAP